MSSRSFDRSRSLAMAWTSTSDVRNVAVAAVFVLEWNSFVPGMNCAMARAATTGSHSAAIRREMGCRHGVPPAQPRLGVLDDRFEARLVGAGAGGAAVRGETLGVLDVLGYMTCRTCAGKASKAFE